MDLKQRRNLVERIADHVNDKEDLVELAFDRSDGDILDTLTCLTTPSIRRRLERKLYQRMEKQYCLPRP